MIRTFETGPGANKKALLAVWDRTSGRKRRQIPRECVKKQGVGKKYSFWTVLGVRGSPYRAKNEVRVLRISPMCLFFFFFFFVTSQHYTTHTPVPHAFLCFPLGFQCFSTPAHLTHLHAHTHTPATDRDLGSGLSKSVSVKTRKKPRNMPEKGKVRGISGEGSFRYRRANRSSSAKRRKTNRTIW